MNPDQVDGVLRLAAPKAPEKPDDYQARKQHDLLQILEEDRATAPTHIRSPRPRKRWARVALVAAGVAVASALMVNQPWSGGGTSVYATTPPVLATPTAQNLSASKDLRAIANRVKALPAAPPSDVSYVATSGWYLNSRAENGDLRTDIEPDVTESWISSDGSIVSRTNGVVGRSSNATMWPGTVFSSQPDELLKQLSEGHPIKSIGTPELFVAIEDLYREANPTPAVRAALLELIARTDDVVANGDMVDRRGRTGRGYSLITSYSGLPTRMTVIFDPVTGRLLDAEDVLIESAGKLNVQIPAVTSYTMFTHQDQAPPQPPN